MRQLLCFLAFVAICWAQLPEPVVYGRTDTVRGASALDTVSIIPRVTALGTLGPSKCAVNATSPITLTCYDDTAGTGAFTAVFRAGVNQGTTDLQQWQNAAGANIMQLTSAGTLYNAKGLMSWASGFAVASDAKYQFSSTTSPSGTADITLSRTSAGRFQGNSGTAGKWGGFDIGTIALQSLATPVITSVTPSANNGQTCTYVLVARLADNTTSTEASAAAGTIDGPTDCNSNTIVWTAAAAPTYYQLSRTAGGTTMGLITAMAAWLNNTTNCPAGVCTYIDANGAASGTAPTVNATGSILFATDGRGTIGTGSAGRPAEIWSKTIVRAGTNLIADSAVYIGYGSGNKGKLGADADGVFSLYDAAGTSFNRLTFGGTTSAFPALKRDGPVLVSRLADDSAYAAHRAKNFEAIDNLAGETLTNGALTGGTSWSQTGDFALTGNAATYTHATGSGTIQQVSGSLTIPGIANTRYVLSYTVSGVTGSPACILTDSFAATDQALQVAAGVYTLAFTSSAFADTADFVIRCVSVAAATITYDTLSLKSVGGGDVIANGNLEARTFSVYGTPLASTHLSDTTGLVRGAASLTTDNALTKVSATDGTLAESGIADSGTAVTMAGRTLSADPGGTVPAWKKYALVAIANGVNGCANANVSAAVFTGGGLDDATSGGAYSGSGGNTYTAIIDGLDSIKTHALNAGGADYAVDDTFTVDTGSTLATGQVTEIGALGAVTSYVILTAGKGYAVANGVATTATLGIGAGLTINITALVDTFKWQKGAGAFTEDVAMTGAAQALADGVTITFAAIVGHTLADEWVITAGFGCWQVNGVLGADKAADVTQDVVLFQLPAKGHISGWRIKTNTVCTGTSTAHIGLGTAGNNIFFRDHTYDIQVAVADTNISNGPTDGIGSFTHAATNVVANLQTTMENVELLVTGCAVDYWIQWAVLP